MALNFNTDIAPLRAQFFPVGGMRASEYRQLRRNYAEVISPLQKESLQLSQNLLNLQQQELSFEKSRLDLATAKRRAQQETDAMGRLPSVSARLDEILVDDTLDAYERSKEIGAYQRSMAGALPHSPALQSLFTSAFGSVQSDLQAQKRRDDAERRKLGLMHTMGQYGAYDANLELAEADGVIDDQEKGVLKFSEIARDRYDAKTRAALEEADIKAQMAQAEVEKGRIKDEVSRMLRHESTLKSLGLIEEGFAGVSLKEGGTLKAPKVASGFEFKPNDRAILEGMVYDLNPDAPLSEIEGADTQDLFETALRQIYRNVRDLQPRIKAHKDGDKSIDNLFGNTPQ
jgi:hypothetical protein